MDIFQNIFSVVMSGGWQCTYCRYSDGNVALYIIGYPNAWMKVKGKKLSSTFNFLVVG